MMNAIPDMTRGNGSRAQREQPLFRFINYLGELGPRWGLPAHACRAHAYLYAVARVVTENEIAEAADLSAAEVTEALAWLQAYRLVTKSGAGWGTETDPWALVTRALDERRRREVGPMLELLRGCRRDLKATDPTRGVAAAQIGRLVGLVEDIAAIDAQARRFSPRTLRRLVGFGGRVSRLLDRGN